MEIIGMILLVIVMVLAFFLGNYAIIDAIQVGDASNMSEAAVFVLFAVIEDFALLYLGFKIMQRVIIPSFRLMRSGIKNRKISKKESAKLKKLLKNEKPDVNRLEELRNKGISESATKRTLHFCQLMEAVAGKEQMQDCVSKVSEKQSIIDEIDTIENRIFKVAESFKNAGDVEQCRYYMGLIKSAKMTREITALEKECEEQLSQREKERKAIRFCKKILLGTFVAVVMIFEVLFIRDTPYSGLRSMIKDQSLTAEMCSQRNRDSEDSYYNYLTSEKGRKFIASELTKLHKDDDVKRAMWLSCIQPNEINGYDLWASPSFIKWIVEYAKDKGVRSTDQDGPDDRSYNVRYFIDGYWIKLASYDDKEKDVSNISGFTISNDEERITIHNWSRHRNNVPIIE